MKEEPKIGIGRDKDLRSSAQGKLYQINMQRLQTREKSEPHFQCSTLRLVLNSTELPLEAEGVMKLGGEGKRARYTITQDAVQIPPPPLSGQYFKLYLATPAIFSQGWKPAAWFDSEKYKKLKLTLLTAAVGKYQPIGGWDMKKRIPKMLYRAVPAGSIYYFHLNDGSLDEVIDCFHGKSVSDVEGYQQQGFGIAYVGQCLEPGKQ